MNSDNQRQEPREPRDDAIHIQVRHGAGMPPQPPLVLHVCTRDISAHGFNASSNMALTIGTVLDVLIELQGNGKPYLLTAEVRWCRPLAADNFSAGFAVIDALGSDYAAWQARF
jgi:hypothetical protein